LHLDIDRREKGRVDVSNLGVRRFAFVHEYMADGTVTTPKDSHAFA
jgi:hypothetical protein